MERVAAADQFVAVYKELRALAASYFRRQRAGHTLSPTALVHEVYLRVARGHAPDDRSHFLAVAATAMRQILTDHARRIRAKKRGSGAVQVSLAGVPALDLPHALDLLAVDEMLVRLDKLDPRSARVVELRVFGGLTEEEIAGVLEVSLRTVQKDWRGAKAWLVRELDKGAPAG